MSHPFCSGVIYRISNFSFNPDDELAAFRSDPSIWISQGRWTNYLVEKYIFPQPVIPYIVPLVFALSLAIAYMFISRTHNLSGDWHAYLVFPVFSAFPIWWFLADFDANLPSVGLGIIIVSLAGFLLSSAPSLRGDKKLILGWLILQSSLLAVAIGAYQALLFMYLAIGISIVITRLLILGTTEQSVSDTNAVGFAIETLSLIGATSITGFILYYVINLSLQVALSIPSDTYIRSYYNLSGIMENPFRVVEVLIREIRLYYIGDSLRYGSPFLSLFMVTFSFGLLFLLRIIQSWDIKLTLVAFFLVVALLSSPFSIILIRGDKPIPPHSYITVSYVVWFMSIFLLRSGYLKKIIEILILILVLQSLVLNSLYAAASYITDRHDFILAADLYNRMASLDSRFSVDELALVDIYGIKTERSVYPAPWGTAVGYSFFETMFLPGEIWRPVHFMRLIGYANISPLNDTGQRIELTPIFENMPAWPASGCVQKIDNIYLIKLSETPDPIHEQYYQK